jgi:hypothetical protein
MEIHMDLLPGSLLISLELSESPEYADKQKSRLSRIRPLGWWLDVAEQGGRTSISLSAAGTGHAAAIRCSISLSTKLSRACQQTCLNALPSEMSNEFGGASHWGWLHKEGLKPDTEVGVAEILIAKIETWFPLYERTEV